MIKIDGSLGEGGGQVIRTALALSSITGYPVQIVNVRGGRTRPGLGAQHLTGLRALASLCGGRIEGDFLGSDELRFIPQQPVKSGNYQFDIADVSHGGNAAGSATLLLHALYLPLAFASARSHLSIRGGTHIPRSPSFDDVFNVWRWSLKKMKLSVQLKLIRWGWFPAGQGVIEASISPISTHGLSPFVVRRRGPLRRVFGRAVATGDKLGAAEKMAQQARTVLKEKGISTEIAVENVDASNAGSGIFLIMEYENCRAGFNAFGTPNRSPEESATLVTNELLSHHSSGTALDLHVADQILLPAAFASERSFFSVDKVTAHIQTNAAIIEKFGLAKVQIQGKKGLPGYISVQPKAAKTGVVLRKSA